MSFNRKKWMLLFVVICFTSSVVQGGSITDAVTIATKETIATEETITDNPNSSNHDRTLVHLRNFVGSDLSVDCKLGDREMGKRTLKDQEGLSIAFKPNSEGTSSVWCDLSWSGKNRRFPVYGDGAERENNMVDVYGNGIYINKMQFAKFT